MTPLRTATAILATAALVAAPAALARGGADDGGSGGSARGDVRVSGSCSASSTAKLKLSDEDGRIEVELEVDQNRNGVPWTVAIRRNGTQVAAARAVTRAPSGSFEVRRVIANGAGPDRVVATARRAGETCTATATWR